MDSWLIFIICCVILWLPGLPCFAQSKDQKFRRLKPGGPWGHILTYLPNWTDFVRAGIVSWVLMQWFQSFLDNNPPEKRILALVAVFGCIVTGTVIQSLVIKHRRIFLIPAFYVMGLLLFIGGWDIGLLAVAGAFGISYGLRQPPAVLPALGVLLVVGGYVIKAPILQLAMGGMVAFLPMVLCLYSNKIGVISSHIPLGRSDMETAGTTAVKDTSNTNT